MFRTPYELCRRLYREGHRRGANDKRERVWGVTPDGSQLELSKNSSDYVVTAYPAGEDGSLSCLVDGWTSAKFMAGAYPILAGARVVPAPKSLHGVYSRGNLMAVLMTQQDHTHKLAWTIFRPAGNEGGKPHFTKTTAMDTFLDVDKWWKLRPRELTRPLLGSAGDRVRLVFRSGKPAAISVGAGAEGISRTPCELFAPNQTQLITNSERDTSPALWAWL